MKFKHGDRVTCKIGHHEISDGRISINKSGNHYICQNVFQGEDTQEKFGYKYAWVFSVNSPCLEFVTELKLKERTITSDPLEEGDILIEKDGETRKVLGICGKAVFVSARYDFDVVAHFFTQKDLAHRGWKLYWPSPEPEIKEVTMEEVANALDIPVENLRIKGENK